MGGLSFLTSTQVQAISDYMVSVGGGGTGGGGGGTLDGPTLYANNCASCHGALASTNKPGRTATQIQNAINNNAGGMGYLSTLTSAEVQAIADALATTGGGGGGGTSMPAHDDSQGGAGHAVDKNTPYSSGCTACHGADLTGGSGPSCFSCHGQQWTEDAPSGGGGTGGGTGGTLDGPTLYANNCASCHGALASTNKPGRTATQIQNAINNNAGGMGYLSTLTSAEVQAIADALATTSGGGGGTSMPAHDDSQGGAGHAVDKDTPYSSGCTACHGANLTGGSGPSCFSCHGEKWNESAPSGSGGTTASTPQGKYQTYCQSCHGTRSDPGPDGWVGGASPYRIWREIYNTSEMNYLIDILTNQDVNDISCYLGGTSCSSGDGGGD
jgi:mono/diheme cytochrome c family protein